MYGVVLHPYREPARSLKLGLPVRTFRTRQTPQRQAGEASVRGSAEEAPEGHWGVVAPLAGGPGRPAGLGPLLFQTQGCRLR